MPRRELAGSHALVTGASSGIGRAIALQLGAAGCQVLVTARRQDRLETLAAEIAAGGGRAVVLPGDVTGAAHRAQLLQLAREQLGGLDILVNNAGVGAVGDFRGASPERLRQIMEVNFFAPAELTRAALDLLSSGRRSVVVNIGSVLGHRAVPGKSEYCASKFALHGFSDSLRSELRRDGVDVVLVSPSTTSSEFFDRLLENDSAVVRNPYRMPPEKVARAVLRAIRRGQREVILPWSGRLLVWLDRLCPALADRVVERFTRDGDRVGQSAATR